jgi:hypothetical protein
VLCPYDTGREVQRRSGRDPPDRAVRQARAGSKTRQGSLRSVCCVRSVHTMRHPIEARPSDWRAGCSRPGQGVRSLTGLSRTRLFYHLYLTVTIVFGCYNRHMCCHRCGMVTESLGVNEQQARPPGSRPKAFKGIRLVTVTESLGRWSIGWRVDYVCDFVYYRM